MSVRNLCPGATTGPRDVLITARCQGCQSPTMRDNRQYTLYPVILGTSQPRRCPEWEPSLSSETESIHHKKAAASGQSAVAASCPPNCRCIISTSLKTSRQIHSRHPPHAGQKKPAVMVPSGAGSGSPSRGAASDRTRATPTSFILHSAPETHPSVAAGVPPIGIAGYRPALPHG